MKRIPNPELDNTILQHLSEKYRLSQMRALGEFHLSTAVYCLTKGYLDATSPILPTDEEVMLYAVGLGLQDMLTPELAATPTFEKDGVIYRPDFVLGVGQAEYHELKTTRMSMKTLLANLPKTWKEYIAGGCYMRGVTTYQLSTLLLMGTYAPPFPKLYSETLVFEQNELGENWESILNKKVTYNKAIESGSPPTPFQYCREWECKNCRYKTICDAIVLVGEKGGVS